MLVTFAIFTRRYYRESIFYDDNNYKSSSYERISHDSTSHDSNYYHVLLSFCRRGLECKLRETLETRVKFFRKFKYFNMDRFCVPFFLTFKVLTQNFLKNSWADQYKNVGRIGRLEFHVYTAIFSFLNMHKPRKTNIIFQHLRTINFLSHWIFLCVHFCNVKATYYSPFLKPSTNRKYQR